jgi:hypothetical protein
MVGVLRCVVQGLAGNHHFARDELLTQLHPELPVRIEVTEGQVLAFPAINDTPATIA